MKIITKTCVALMMSATFLLGAELEPVELRCEYLKNPLGIDVVKPRLSWKIEVGEQKSEVRDQSSEIS